MKLVDLDGNDVAAGEVGEIAIRGDNVMKGYWSRPEATAEAIPDGWFRTGDLATVDEEGYYTIVDRKKDMIIRGGLNVYPREVEEVLYEHPDVLEAAVVGVPDDLMGEEVGAAVALRPGASADVGRAARLRQGAARGLQVPAQRVDRRRAAQGPDGQDPPARGQAPSHTPEPRYAAAGRTCGRQRHPWAGGGVPRRARAPGAGPAARSPRQRPGRSRRR